VLGLLSAVAVRWRRIALRLECDSPAQLAAAHDARLPLIRRSHYCSLTLLLLLLMLLLHCCYY
jgi:hypothetical protein